LSIELRISASLSVFFSAAFDPADFSRFSRFLKIRSQCDDRVPENTGESFSLADAFLHSVSPARSPAGTENQVRIHALQRSK
jgi:hypothetical protein